jgi:hypothetical protein
VDSHRLGLLDGGPLGRHPLLELLQLLRVQPLQGAPLLDLVQERGDLAGSAAQMFRVEGSESACTPAL